MRIISVEGLRNAAEGETIEASAEPAKRPAPPSLQRRESSSEGSWAVEARTGSVRPSDRVHELPDAELTPDSEDLSLSDEEAPPSLDDIFSDEATPLPPELEDVKTALHRPPPPPRRASPPTAGGPEEREREDAEAPAPPRNRDEELQPTSAGTASKEADDDKKPTRRPWWEELFREDFLRAEPRITTTQIRREVDFIEESLGVVPGGVILDLGCGSGQHAVELSSRGYSLVGYDLSLYQLALAGDVAEEREQKINFLQGDMRDMAFEEMFDGLYCWNTSFGYFEEEKNSSVAQRMFRALRPGGMLLMDVVNRDFAAQHSPSQVWYEGDACVCMDDMNVDFITSRLKVKRSLILDDGRQREVTYSIRVYSLHELGKLLHDVGFRVTEASGHPSTPGVFFGPCSPRIIILAQKP